MPECTKNIGYQAFENCTALQGGLINSTDQITIKNEAFSGCSALRVFASNATLGIIDVDYDVFADCPSDGYQRTFYVPTVNYGYTQYCQYFTEESGVYSYKLVDIGGTGKMLYGADAEGNPWLALGSGKTVDDVGDSARDNNGDIALPDMMIMCLYARGSGPIISEITGRNRQRSGSVRMQR